MKNKIYLMFAIAFFSIAQSYSQNLNLQWGKSFTMTSSSNSMGISSMKTDNLGNLVCLGVFKGTVDFDPSGAVYNLSSTISTQEDIFIMKLDSSGNFLWAEKLGDGVSHVEGDFFIDSDNKIYIDIGFSMGSVDVDPGPGVVTVSTAGTVGITVFIKLSKDGNYINHLNFGPPGSGAGFSCQMNTLGQIILIGGAYPGTDLDNGPGTFIVPGSTWSNFIVRYDTAFNFKAGYIPAGVSWYEVGLDNSGNIYYEGYFDTDTVDYDFGAGTAYLSLNNDYAHHFILKTDSSFNFQWVTGYSNSSMFYTFRDFYVSPEGSTYITAELIDTLHLVYNMNTPYLVSTNDNFVVLKWNTNGQYTNSLQLNDVPFFYDIKVDAVGRAYITGEFGGTLDFDPGPGTSILNGGTFGSIFIAIYDSTLDFLNAFAIGGPCVGGYTGYSLTLDNNNNLFLNASFCDTIDFDVNYGTYNLPGSTTFFNGALLKYNTAQNGYVWPGDANEDLVADNYDLLPIGLYINYPGLARPVANNTWAPHVSNDWSILQGNGVNLKFADCNGNGTIGLTDISAINQNYGQSHPFRLQAPENISTSFSSSVAPDLYFVTSSSTYTAGSLVDVEIWVADSLNQMDLYSIAFNVNYDVSLVQPGTVSLTYPVSFLGTPGSTAFTISNTDNDVDGAITKISLPAHGYGNIATLHFQLASSITAPTVMNFNFTNYQAYYFFDSLITFNLIPDSILVNPVGIEENLNNFSLSVSPNPAQDIVQINSSQNFSAIEIILFDASGRIVMEKKLNKEASFSVKQLNAGIYFYKIKDAKGNEVRGKLVKE